MGGGGGVAGRGEEGGTFSFESPKLLITPAVALDIFSNLSTFCYLSQGGGGGGGDLVWWGGGREMEGTFLFESPNCYRAFP